MKTKALLIILSIFLGPQMSSAQSSNRGKVDVMDLKYLLQDCRSVPNEVRCLRQGIQSLVRQSEMPAPAPQNLVCRSGNNGKFAVYDNSTNKFLDDHYMKTADECRRSMSTSYIGLFCAVGGNGKYAVRRIFDAKFLSPSYSISFDSCLTSIETATYNYICIAGSNGLYARYDLQKGTYLDTRYSMNLDDCVNLLP